MSLYDSPLENLRIASPCSADWDAMYGDARKRFCGECKLNVYNLSGMARHDADHLLRMSEGAICVRYYQRADGTILTQNCPVGWARVKRRATLIASAAFSLIFSMLAGLYFASLFGKTTELGRGFPMPFATPTPRDEPLMGVSSLRGRPTPRRLQPQNLEVRLKWFLAARRSRVPRSMLDRGAVIRAAPSKSFLSRHEQITPVSPIL